MSRIKGDRLHVNLGASQVRKRLKGLGFGVRKVLSEGKGQAVIVHTATGRHLEQLRAVFADVLAEPAAKQVPVEELRNLGPVSSQWLREVGVHTRADLEELGPVLVYQFVRQRHPDCSLNLLWALAAALEDINILDLTSADKERLLRELD